MGKQKRSENTYQKINTIFKRDKYNIIMPYDNYVDPVFEYMKDCLFEATEKIDGTNIRIEVTSTVEYDVEDGHEERADVIAPTGVKFAVEYKGKTDNAEMPKGLVKYFNEVITPDKVLNALGLKSYIPVSKWAEHKWVDGLTADPTRIPKRYTLYGEGYGAGIQSGGYYRKDNAFIGFDVKVDDMYLLSDSANEIFDKLGVETVPFLGMMTLSQAIEFVRKGFNSIIAEETHPAEGLVLKTPYGICDRRGNRVIAKVKTGDWNKYYKKYGTYDKVEQETN